MAQSRRVMNMPGRPLDIAFIIQYWDIPPQRPHHFVRQALQAQHRVTVYTNLRPMRQLLGLARRIPNAGGLAPKRPLCGYCRSLIYRCLPTALRIRCREKMYLQHIDAAVGANKRRHDIFIYQSVPRSGLPAPNGDAVLVYDCMDDWRGFPSTDPRVPEWEDQLIRQADATLVISNELKTRFSGLNCRVELVPNACEYEHFSSRTISGKAGDGSPVIGYIGAIHDWFDWEAVESVARCFPEAKVRIAGPAGKKPKDPPDNLQLLGIMPYSQAPDFVADCDVCLIPFQTEISYIRAVSPIKLYEYLAGGKPVVSAPMADTIRLAEDGVLYLAETPAQYCDQVRRALAASRTEAHVRRRKAIAEANSWKSRWEVVENILIDLIQNRKECRQF